MRLPLSPTVFFPKSAITTAFGWDPWTFPRRPRIHPAIDRAGAGVVHNPLEATSSQWIDNDAEECSVLRLFVKDAEFRFLHFIREELDSGVIAATMAKAALTSGAPIGPTGNHGLSVPSKGGSGRHVHLSVILKPSSYDEELSDRIGAEWNRDRMGEFREKLGRAFITEVTDRGIVWMNDRVIARHDPYYDGALRYFVDPTIFGL